MRRTALAALHEARGAHWVEHHGWEIPAWFAGVEPEYGALQEGVGILDLSHRTRLRITGRDRRSWFHGQCSQDITGLADGRGAYGTVMDVKGHMVCDVRVFALPDALLLDFPPGTDPIAAYLDRFLVMERCEIEELTDTWAHISVQGPQSGYLLGAVLGADVPSQAEWEVRCYPLTDAEVVVARVFRCGEDGFDLFLPAPLAAPLCAELSQPRPAFALHSIGWEALNVRRVEAGIPWWGFELSPAIVPLEARLDHAVCRSKGCYVGQEIIARIDARGHVNNLLGGVLVESDQLPPHNAEIYAGGKRVGRTCSAVRSVRLGRNIALAYFRRELHRPGEILEALTPSGPLPLVVASLPFVPDDSPQFAPPASGG